MNYPLPEHEKALYSAFFCILPAAVNLALFSQILIFLNSLECALSDDMLNDSIGGVVVEIWMAQFSYNFKFSNYNIATQI